MAVIKARTTPTARETETTATWLATNSGAPPILIKGNSSVPATAVAGMISTGSSSQEPQRAAPASRSAGVVVAGAVGRRPRAPTPTSTRTSSPFSKSVRNLPARKARANRPQKVALIQRRRLAPSRALARAMAAKTTPAKR